MSSEQPIDTLTTAPVIQKWPHGPTTFERRYGNGKMRVVTAIIGIPIVLGTVLIGGWAFFGLITLASIGALLEFYWMAEKKGAHPNKVLGVIVILLLSLQFLPKGERRGIGTYWILPYNPDTIGLLPRSLIDPILNIMSLLQGLKFPLIVIPLILGIEMFRRKDGAILNFGTTLAGITYIGFCFIPLIAIYQIEQVIPQDVPTGIGAFYVIAILLSIWICDSFAYYGGRLFGRHKLFERVSPKKTWEGAICGVIGAVGTMIGMCALIQPLVPLLTIYDAIIIGLICGVFGQLGDLAESHLKRDAGVKDSSQLIPGHGGILDRFDSLLFVSPLVYLYLLVKTGSMWLQ